MRIAIVAGGPEHLIPDLSDPLYRDCQWASADRGTFVLLKQGIKPVIAFGDFDSVSATEYAAIQKESVHCVTYPREKDKTDLELAVDWALEKNPEELIIFGATGGRADHGLASVYLLLKASGTKTKMRLLDRKNSIRLLNPGIYQLERDPLYHYLSFLALSDRVTGITLRGVKYPLTDAKLVIGSSLCISNEAERDSFSVSLKTGLLLMMRCSD
ncbi:MAG: thiamine diphosphokinase [Sporolactobacillus sp.]